MLKHYVKLFRNKDYIWNKNADVIIEIPKRDKAIIMELVRNDKKIWAYYFFDRNVVIAEDGELLIGREKNVSNMIKVRECFTRVNDSPAGVIASIGIPGRKRRRF